jgi:hypothetical protein
MAYVRAVAFAWRRKDEDVREPSNLLARALATAPPAAAVLGAILAMALDAAPAAAHERRASGGFELTVGWGEEPAYTGVKNRVQVSISEAGGAPVTDAGAALALEVGKGSDRITLPLEPEAGVDGSPTPGTFQAGLTPTQPGTYTVRVTGSLRGQRVDETFTSSETTFDEVLDAANIQFPGTEPSTGQLATRIEREIPRAVEAGLRRAQDQVDQARTLAVVGVVVGAVGLLTAGAALIATTRRARPGGVADGGGSTAGAQGRDGAAGEPGV